MTIRDWTGGSRGLVWERFLAVMLAVGMATTAAAVSLRAGDAAPGRSGVIPGQTTSQTIMSGGVTRTYLVHLPPAGRLGDLGKAKPVVFVFHGGFGTADQAEKMCGFSPLADRDRVIVVYPQGWERDRGHNWNDGRGKSLTAQKGISDVEFVLAILDRLGRDQAIDRARVFATGVSNGAIFSYRLGLERADVFAAIAPVAGSIAQPIAGQAPARPLSILHVHGTEDERVPYGGGVVNSPDGGRVIGVDESLATFRKAGGCKNRPTVRWLPDTNKADGCKVQEYLYQNARKTVRVKHLKIVGGMHNWPGYVRPGQPGTGVCQDLGNIGNTIWEFFLNPAGMGASTGSTGKGKPAVAADGGM